jgi:SAM-dependent methyltransferase
LSWEPVPDGTTVVMRQIHPHARYAVLDHSLEMLQVARHNFEREGMSNVACAVGVAENLDFADNSFDLITSQSMFRHLADKVAAIREAYRAIRPGGLVYFSDLVGDMDKAEKDLLCNEAPGLNGPTFIRAAVDSAISREEVEEFLKCSGVPKWECLVGGLGGFSLTSRQIVEWCKRGFPLRNLKTSSEATDWSRRLFAHWIHIYLYKC